MTTGVQRRLTFGVDRIPDEIAVERTKTGAAKTNPCVPAFGPGPEGAKCGDCVHFFMQGGVAGTYYKCELRAITGGPGSDHRVRWPACAKYEPTAEAIAAVQPRLRVRGR